MTLRGRLTVAALAALVLLPAGRLTWATSHPSAPPVVAAAPAAPEREAPSPARRALQTALQGEAPPWPLPPTARGGPAPGPEVERWIEPVPASAGEGGLAGPLHVEYTLDPALSREVRRILRRGRVGLGHVIVMDPASGRLLAYVSTAPERLPATRVYPAASLMKVVTAAAALDRRPERARRPCRYRGSPWRLTLARLDAPAAGRSVSLRRALATSNNQCFARLAVNVLGADALFAEIERLGLLQPPAPGHDAGRLERERNPLAVGKLGCGLAGCRITPLAAARLAAALAEGRAVAPRWVERVTDAAGREILLPDPPPSRRVLEPGLAAELREMLVDTTVNGTARRAFRTRRGPLLGPVRVAGKTGSVSGRDPNGRYEWFIGVAPADRPRVAVATLVVQSDLWLISSSQLAAEVLKTLFCPSGVCSPDAVTRWLG